MATYILSVSIFVSLLSIRTTFSLSSDCGGGACTPLTTEEKQKLLDIHNELRDRVAGGGLTSSGHPPATDMNYLIWDDGLENVAQAYSESCPGLQHNSLRGIEYLTQRNSGNVKWGPDSQYFGNFCFNQTANASQDCIYIGENVIAGGSSSYTIDSIVSSIESGWFDEYKWWTFGNHNSQCQSGKMCGHYTQMVWANTRYLGCGYSNGCHNGFVFVCNYWPAGNFGVVPPYTQATSSNICGSCMSDRTVCQSNYVSRSNNAASYPQPYNALCDGGACPTMCDGASYDKNSCDGTGCDGNNIDCNDGTIDTNSGRNICTTQSPTATTISPTTMAPTAPTAPTTTTLAPTPAGPPSCLILSNYQFGGFNGEWQYHGENENKPAYNKDDDTYILEYVESPWSKYVLHDPPRSQSNPAGYGYCDQSDINHCISGTWYYYSSAASAYLLDADAAITPCPTTPTTTAPTTKAPTTTANPTTSAPTTKSPTTKSPTDAPTTSAAPTSSPTFLGETCGSIIEWNYRWSRISNWNEGTMGTTYCEVAEELFIDDYPQCGEYNSRTMDYYYYFEWGGLTAPNKKKLDIWFHFCCGDGKTFGPNYVISDDNPNKARYQQNAAFMSDPESSLTDKYGTKQYIVFGIVGLTVLCFCGVFMYFYKQKKKGKKRRSKTNLANSMQMSRLPGPPQHIVLSHDKDSTDGSTDGSNKYQGRLIHMKHNDSSDSRDGFTTNLSPPIQLMGHAVVPSQSVEDSQQEAPTFSGLPPPSTSVDDQINKLNDDENIDI